MIRHLLTAKAILLVTLAALQGLVLAAFPMVNYWRSDIETLLSERLDAKFTILRSVLVLLDRALSGSAEYCDRERTGSIEVRRVEMLLDLPASLELSQPVIDQLVLDEGEIIQRESTGGAFPVFKHGLDFGSTPRDR